MERLKEQSEKQKKQMKELEDEKDEMLDKIHTLKKEKSVLENQIVYGNNGKGGVDERTDFEKTKMKEKIDELYAKIQKKKDKLAKINRENNFYH